MYKVASMLLTDVGSEEVVTGIHVVSVVAVAEAGQDRIWMTVPQILCQVQEAGMGGADHIIKTDVTLDHPDNVAADNNI
jgi:hypothetical protein